MPPNDLTAALEIRRRPAGASFATERFIVREFVGNEVNALLLQEIGRHEAFLLIRLLDKNEQLMVVGQKLRFKAEKYENISNTVIFRV